MCGIFGGLGITLEESKDAIKLIRRGEDGITVTQLSENIIFAARRHLVKNSGNEEIGSKIPTKIDFEKSGLGNNNNPKTSPKMIDTYAFFSLIFLS